MKHKFCGLIFALLSPILIGAQTPATVGDWAKRLKAFGQSIPQEEVFLHMDNTCYYLGDTIYYKAYMRLSTGRPSTLSRMLYVELLNADGFLVERQKVEMTNGQGHGTFALCDTLYGGFYELRAYTRWQLNWGQYEHPHSKNAEEWFYSEQMAREYYRDYEKLYSRVFPVYGKPTKPGQYDESMTTRHLSRYFRHQTPTPQADITFYPEGGNLVEGTECRVAFQADDHNTGEHLKGNLVVLNNNGQQIVTAKTESRGRGSFVLPVKAGEQYKAEFLWGENRQSVSLPKAEREGIAMHVEQATDGIKISWQATGLAASEPLGMTATQHGVTKAFYEMQPNKQNMLTVPFDSLQTGVVQLTVFNAQGRIWADRLAFANKGDLSQSNINISGIQPNGYEAYAPVSMTLKGTPDATISVAVRDNENSTYTFDTGNILTEMLLCSQIKGYVEQPEYYFEANDEKHQRALDLLLMVQGWRRYKWVEMATPNAFTITQPYERTEWLYGQVNKYQTVEQENQLSKAAREALAEANMDADAEIRAADKAAKDAARATINANEQQEELTDMQKHDQKVAEDRQRRDEADLQSQQRNIKSDGDVARQRFQKNEGNLKREVRVHAEFVQPGTENSTAEGEMDTYNKGMFRIQAPKLYEACFFFFDASDTTTWQKDKQPIWIAQSEDKNNDVEFPEFYVKLNRQFPRFVKPYSFYQTTLPMHGRANGRAVNLDDAIVLREVSVGAKHSGSRGFDVTQPALVVDAYEAFNEVVDAGLCPGYFIGGERFTYDVARTYIGDMNQSRNYPLERRYNTLSTTRNIPEMVREKYNHLPNLNKVYIYTDYSPRLEGDPKYNQSNQPKVIVDLRRYEDGTQRIVYRNRRMILTGFAVCDDFYHPNYSTRPTGEPTDYRRTLYWEPNLKLDASGQATVQFYNNARHTTLNVSAEGMTPSGQPVTGQLYSEDLR